MLSTSLNFRSLLIGAALAAFASGQALASPISPLPPGGPDVALNSPISPLPPGGPDVALDSPISPLPPGGPDVALAIA